MPRAAILAAKMPFRADLRWRTPSTSTAHLRGYAAWGCSG